MQLQRQSEEAEGSLRFLDDQIEELEKFSNSLNVLESSDESEMLASIGKGVYVKTALKKEEKLFVEVGKGIVVRKKPAEAKETITEQIRKFKNVRVQIAAQLNDYTLQLKEMISEIEKLRDQQKTN